jgi:hypothetical protein
MFSSPTRVADYADPLLLLHGKTIPVSWAENDIALLPSSVGVISVDPNGDVTGRLSPITRP